MQSNLDELLERVKSGDREAFELLYLQTSRQVDYDNRQTKIRHSHILCL